LFIRFYHHAISADGVMKYTMRYSIAVGRGLFKIPMQQIANLNVYWKFGRG